MYWQWGCRKFVNLFVKKTGSYSSIRFFSFIFVAIKIIVMAAIIPKIRAGNQFNYLWAIERAGVAVDLTTATDIVLSYGVGKPCADYSIIPFTVVDVNKISSSHLYGVTGTYNLKLEFKIDGDQSTIDIDAFRIVPRSEDASDSTQFAVTSDMAIGFKGEKGDPFLYSDFTPEHIAELQQPANDAIASIQAVEVSVEQAEALRVQAEIDRETYTGTAIQNAETATELADTAAALANIKAELADTAAALANTKAELADTAAALANTKAELANTAATNANNVANGYAAELALKEVKANKQNSLAVDGTGVKFPTVDAVNVVADLVPALQGLKTVTTKNQYYPIIENNTGAILGKHQVFYWNVSAWSADNSIGVGVDALANNTGAYSVGIGYFALANNTGIFSVGIGYFALANNTGAYSVGIGYFALINNIGSGSAGVGRDALYNNTGASTNGIGYGCLKNNTGSSSNAIGNSALIYNQKANNSAFGHNAYSVFMDNTAGNKTADSTAVDITLERIAITAHGFGATNAIVNIKYASTTGTAIGGLAVGTIYQVKIIDANTIEFIIGATKRNLTSQGTGTHTFTPQFAYENTTCLGANTQPNKDNQVVLGDTAVDTVKMGGTARTIASATATGVKGEWCWDANYIYVCIATNTWKRIALTTW